MRYKKRNIIFYALVAFLLTSCFHTSEIHFFLLRSSDMKDANLKKIGCNEYLVFVSRASSGTATLRNTMEELLNGDTRKYPGLFTATGFKDHYIVLDDVIEPENPTIRDPFRVYLKTAPEIGLTGVCDVPRIKEQITETVRIYAGTKPFQIVLDGKVKNWECLGDESGLCK